MYHYVPLSVNRMAAGLRLHRFFFFHLLFKHILCSKVKGFRPQGLLVYRLCLPPDTPIIFTYFALCCISLSTHPSYYILHTHAWWCFNYNIKLSVVAMGCICGWNDIFLDEILLTGTFVWKQFKLVSTLGEWKMS